MVKIRSNIRLEIENIFEIPVKDDMFGYVAASPDKSYLIAVGLR